MVVAVAVVVPSSSACADAWRVDDLGGVEHLLGAEVGHGVVDGRLEAALVDDEVGVLRGRRSG